MNGADNEDAGRVFINITLQEFDFFLQDCLNQDFIIETQFSQIVSAYEDKLMDVMTNEHIQELG